MGACWIFYEFRFGCRKLKGNAGNVFRNGSEITRTIEGNGSIFKLVSKFSVHVLESFDD